MFARVVFLPALLAIGSVSAQAQIPPGYRAVPISSGEYWDLNARLNNQGQIVFERWNTARRLFEAWFWEDGLLSPLAVDDTDNRLPDINDDGVIVWSRAIGPPGPWGPTYEIVILREGQLTRLTDDGWDDYGPRINNLGHITWYKVTTFVENPYTSEIMFFDGTTMRQITNDTPVPRSSQSPAINEFDQIVWTRYDDSQPVWQAAIMMYDSGVITQISPDWALQQNVELNNLCQVVWEISTGGGQRGIRAWEAGTTILLTDWGGWPHINDAGDIVFYRWYPVELSYQAWLYRSGQYHQITFDHENDNLPTDINEFGEFVYTSGTPGHKGVIYVARLAPGDLDADGDVDLGDFTIFQLCFGGSAAPPAATCPLGMNADLDGDGDVDLADFVIFQQNFTGSR